MEVLPILSKIEFSKSLHPNSDLVIKSFSDSQALGWLARLYRAHLKFYNERGFDDHPADSPFRTRPYTPEKFIENMIRAFSCPVDREPRPPNEWNTEHTAQIKRLKKLMAITDRSEHLSFEITISELLYFKYVIGGGLDLAQEPKFEQFLNIVKNLGSLNKILTWYIEFLESNPEYEIPFTRDKFALIVNITTRRLYELTGSSKYITIIKLINKIHNCNKSEGFAKKHSYKMT